MRKTFGFLLLLSGCGGHNTAAGFESSDAGVEMNRVATDGGAVVKKAEIEGYWHSDLWGDLVLRNVGDETWGAYSYDTGTVRGTFKDGVFTGWWCEVPTRLPPTDAGDVIFEFARDENDSLYFEGKWRYASEVETNAAYREDWDLTLVPDEPPADLVARFNDPSAFCPEPQ